MQVEKRAFAHSVLHVGKYYPPHMGGIETHLKQLVSHQSSSMAVEVLVANDGPTTRTELVDGAKIVRVATFGTIASQPLCPSLPWNLAGRTDSIVHLHLPNPWAAHAYLMSRHKGKLIVTHHADTVGRRQLRRFIDPFVRETMRRAVSIIVTSKRYLQSSEELREFRNKCRVVPLGINADPFEAPTSDDPYCIRQKYGERLLVAVGRLVPYKGFEYLLEAMRNVDGTLLLIGTGPLRDRLEAKIRELGIGQKAHLLGYVDDAVPYYAAAKLLVLPSVSRAESFGLVQVEAMAAGIPVVNTNIESGVPEVSLHGVTGLTVPPMDVCALEQAIELLLNHEDIRRKYGAAARARAREEYSAQRMAESTLKVYELFD